ncbi:hypothetical protein V6N12_065446 [Hibiscus sabdariffa]|uniref:Uncharacterized protein n=1 Tax=Hibiscus sabdariffa TaxID=183260 RepID=A0ABR2G9I8_9ROSI
MLKKFFVEPKVPTEVLTESLIPPAIIAIPPPVMTVDMILKIPPPPLLTSFEEEMIVELEVEIQNSTTLSLHEVFKTVGLCTSTCDLIRGKARMFVVGSISGLEADGRADLDNLNRGLLGYMPSVPIRFSNKTSSRK